MSEETREDLPNTPSVQTVIERGDVDEVRMILGDRDRIRYSGIIRPGIKVPLGRCTEQEKKIYADLYAQGKSFEEIDKAMGGDPPKKSKLRPSNADYFTVREVDFRNPADARMINEKYADPDGKIRRIPCWFPIGELHLVIPHNFRSFDGAGNVRAASFYDSHGELTCRYVPKDVKNPKKEDWLVRPCPGDGSCQAYTSKKCVFGGLYKVTVPGVKGMGEIIVPTNSWNGLADAIANLKRIAGILGRFNGLFNGQPFLEICKVQEEVRTPDGKRQNQWLVTIEPSVDLMELARHAEQTASRGFAAIGMFNGSGQSRKPDPAFYQETLAVPYDSGPGAATSTVAQPEEDPAPFGDEDPAMVKAMEYLHATAKHLGVTWEALAAYVQHEYPKAVDKMNIDELRDLAGAIKKEMVTKDDRDRLTALINDIHRGIGGGEETPGDELPFN